MVFHFRKMHVTCFRNYRFFKGKSFQHYRCKNVRTNDDLNIEADVLPTSGNSDSISERFFGNDRITFCNQPLRFWPFDG